MKEVNFYLFKRIFFFTPITTINFLKIKDNPFNDRFQL